MQNTMHASAGQEAENDTLQKVYYHHIRKCSRSHRSNRNAEIHRDVNMTNRSNEFNQRYQFGDQLRAYDTAKL